MDAPEIDRPGLHWFNVAAPLRLADLRGRIVLLDFWTFCCVNCLHVLPTLARLEERFPDEVVVIGVHSPKFPAEQDPEKVAHAIARHRIRHPVVHDPEKRLWRDYGVRAWPSLVAIDPSGRILGQVAGEPDPDRLITVVGKIVEAARAGGVLAAGAALATAAPESAAEGRFLFPGKIRPLTGHAEARWALADAGHHQIVLLDDQGQEVLRIGRGAPGFADGRIADARFDSPQSLVCRDTMIYVADTGNHALRRVDLATGLVVTIAGTGHRGPPLYAPTPARQVALASPWDLALTEDWLVIANAGTHQLGLLDLSSGLLGCLAGTGSENIADGPARAAKLAQPSGLALGPDNETVYVADSETSAIRMLKLREGRLVTLAGTGLFDFGHRNGDLAQALFQHPLGLACQDGRLLVADSYNDCLRELDIAAHEVRDFGTDFTCTDALCRPLDEPSGVTLMPDGRVLASDTNNHRILLFDSAARTYHTWAA